MNAKTAGSLVIAMVAIGLVLFLWRSRDKPHGSGKAVTTSKPPSNAEARRRDIEHDRQVMARKTRPKLLIPDPYRDGGTIRLKRMRKQSELSPEERARNLKASQRITKHENRLNKLNREIKRGRIKGIIGREFTKEQIAQSKAEFKHWQDNFISHMLEWRQGKITPTQFAEKMDVVSASVFDKMKKVFNVTDKEWEAIKNAAPPPNPTREHPEGAPDPYNPR